MYITALNWFPIGAMYCFFPFLDTVACLSPAVAAALAPPLAVFPDMLFENLVFVPFCDIFSIEIQYLLLFAHLLFAALLHPTVIYP